MRQLRQMLRLLHDGVSAREVGVARSTVQDNRAKTAGLAWRLAPDLKDDVLEQRLFSNAGYSPGARRRVEPDWARLTGEVKRPGVIVRVLWDEDATPIPRATATAASAICFRAFERRLDQ